MKIIKNEKLIKRNQRIGNWTTLGAVVFLFGALYGTLGGRTATQIPFYAFLAFIIGLVLMQIGLYMGNRYGRSPRPDEKLDTGLKGLPGDYTMYHFATPASHLLVGPAGVWALMAYHQRGQVTFKKNRWRIGGGGFAQAYMRIFGQEGLGRPDLEIESEISSLKKFLAKHLDESEIPAINALMVFTSEGVEIDAEDAPIPTMKLKQMKEFIRRQARQKSLPPAALTKIKAVLE